MRPANDVPRTNAGSLEHSELVRMIAEANGAQVHELGAMWNDLGSEIIGFGASLQRAANSSESIWIGQAATAARMKLSELVAWCQETGQGMQHMGTTVMRTQADSAATAQVSMPAPVPYDPAAYQNRINSTSNPIEWVQILGDAREQAARHDAAHAAAVRVIETYSASLLSTNGTMPAFTPPPEFGSRDTGPGPGVPAPGGSGGGADSSGSAGSGGGAGGSPGSGGRPQIAPGSGGGGPGGGSPVPGGDSPGPGGGGPGGGGHPPETGPPAPTPGQVASHVPGSPGPSVAAGGGGGTGGTGVPGLLPATAGVGAAGRGSGAGDGGFGPRGSGVLNALGRGGLASTSAAESATGAGKGVAGLAGRGPGGGPGAGGALPPMVGGGRGQGAEDTEHRRPSYLVETEDIWGDGRRVAPPVIGEDPPEYYR
ncbi:MAG: hypothetical protein ACRDRP_14905 [Pseudonocardiaceae bacterium]